MKERWLFAVLVVLHLLPFWVVAHVPTLDGPSHVYNAWVLRHYGDTAGHPRLQELYEIDHTPLPNWSGHAVLALLMVPFSPAVAEKILVSGYVVLFLTGARYLAGAADAGRRWLAYLAFPLVYNVTLQFGFYNFCFSLAFFLFTLGFWWRRRHDPGWGLAAGINLLLLLCWFSHILSQLLALFAIGVLWLTTLRRATWKRHLRHVLILAPQVLLPLWFVRSQGGDTVRGEWQPAALWDYFRGIKVLWTFGAEQLQIGAGLAVLFLVLTVLTLLCTDLDWTAGRPRLVWRDEDGFLIVAVAAFVLYFASPEGMSGGSLVRMRLSLYPWLLLLPWLAPRLTPGLARWERPARWVLVAALAAVSAFNVALNVGWYRVVDREVEAFLAVAPRIDPGARVLPILFDRRVSIGVLGFLGHAVDHAAAERGFIDWGNYEAQTRLFPVHYRDGVERPDIGPIEIAPWYTDVRTPRDQIDFVYCWKVPPGSPLAHHLRRFYALVAEEGPARLFERKERIHQRDCRENGKIAGCDV
jgi:hypothetical protein